MPSRALLFDGQARPVFDFGTGSRNRVLFSPHGRFLMLAGFGNVAGAMEFWDKNKKKLIGSATIPATSPVGWSPCSRYFVCATLWPRLRVDNGYNVIKYDGSVVFRHRHPSEFYAICFRPAAPGVYPDRPASPNAGSNVGGSAAAAAVAKPAAYVPPHLRGVAAPAVQKLHNYEPPKKIEVAVQVTHAFSLSNHVFDVLLQMRWKPDDAPRGPALPPGAEVLNAPSQKAPGDLSKSALKKQKQKQKEAARAELSNAIDQVKALNMGVGASAIVVEEEVDWGKRLKAVQKKLRQLDDLRAAQEAGQELNADQLLKLQSQSALEEEQQFISNKMKVQVPCCLLHIKCSHKNIFMRRNYEL
jgi:translation initiation factor 2A